MGASEGGEGLRADQQRYAAWEDRGFPWRWGAYGLAAGFEPPPQGRDGVLARLLLRTGLDAWCGGCCEVASRGTVRTRRACLLLERLASALPRHTALCAIWVCV